MRVPCGRAEKRKAFFGEGPSHVHGPAPKFALIRMSCVACAVRKFRPPQRPARGGRSDPRHKAELRVRNWQRSPDCVHFRKPGRDRELRPRTHERWPRSGPWSGHRRRQLRPATWSGSRYWPIVGEEIALRYTCRVRPKSGVAWRVTSASQLRSSVRRFYRKAPCSL